MNVFGGFTNIQWEISPGSYMLGENKSFIFKVMKEGNVEFIKSKNKKREVYNGDNLMCCFGRYDLWIHDECDQTDKNNSDIGDDYCCPSEVIHGTPQSKSYLAGAHQFYVNEIELY